MYTELVAAGLSAFPVSDGQNYDGRPAKQPLVTWKPLQEKPAAKDALEAWEKMFGEAWVGVACGPVSGGLEVLDFDIPGKVKGQKPPAWAPWVKLLKDNGYGDLLKKLIVYTTASGGKQVLYRCKGLADGNQKLARRHKDVLIETRGVGGYVVCPPTPGYKLQNGTLETIPILTLDERNTLIEAARLLDESEPEPVQEPREPSTATGTRPGDDYDTRKSWGDVLEPLGWKRGRNWGDKTYWVRPGKSVRDGHSAISDDTHLYVYSSSTDLPQEKQLSKFAVYTHAYHKGDFGKAARQLAKDGFGTAAAPSPTVNLAPSIAADLEGTERKQYNLTDAGNAKRFIDLFAGRVKYCHAWGKWLIWDGARWCMEEKGGAGIYDLALQMAGAIAEEAAGTDDKETRESLSSWSLKCEQRAKIDNCLHLVRASLRIAVEPAELDSNPWLLNCQNGTVDLKTGDLKPHDPGDLITRVAGTDYDPDAKFDTWEKFLARIMPATDLQLFVYKAIGYSLSASTKEQVFFFLYGNGSNGKTTFVETIQHILGGYARTMQSDSLMVSNSVRGGGASPDIARLKGARYVVAAETEEGRRLDEGLVKQLTGGDRIVARYLYQEEFEFSPELKLWMHGNHKPTIKGADNGIWRRVRLIPFTVQIPEEERDADLAKKLLAEAPGILRWMIMGCLSWQEEGLKAPNCVIASSEDYRSEMDVLGRFLSDKCQSDTHLSITSSRLYDAFKLWQISEGIYQWSQTKFSMALEERGYEKDRNMHGKFFKGVDLL